MVLITEELKINQENLNDFLNNLKAKYGYDRVDSAKKTRIKELVNKYGYLPYSHITALKELTPAETIVALEAKLLLNKTLTQSGFSFEEGSVSAVKRAGYKDAAWMQAEQHSIKLINLAGLGNGNESKQPGKFMDWLKQLVTLPSGNPEKRVLSTTAYLIPFHPREFGCAYIPKHSGVSEGLRDENIELSSKDQVRLFIAFTQLAGHPVIYDVLPQTGRFSKIILANPYAARWFDIKELIEIEDEDLKREMSDLMMREDKQKELSARVQAIVNATSEEEISDDDHGEFIEKLIFEGLWPAPGGAWNSAGTPVFDKMSDDGGHPVFKHYNIDGEDVTEYANLDCQTPYYFVCLENGKFNDNVVDFFINLMKKLQKDYNFDGFRVDHIDHITDRVSEKELAPISYRAPRQVLRKLNEEMKKETPYFGSLAEYMLWDDMFEEYHKDMGFDVLWGNDIVSQYQKDVVRIIKDNKQIEEYNKTSGADTKMSILKAYNNQDGEFSAINQYPGQLGEAGALFKWLKLKFLPGGEFAQRPVLYIDGDESFTKTGIEAAIGAEESMPREENTEFYAKFDAIERFAKANVYGKPRVLFSNKETGVICWVIEPAKIMVVANELPPQETCRDEEGEWEKVRNTAAENVQIAVPYGVNIEAEYIYDNVSKDFAETGEIKNLCDNKLGYDKLEPSEFHIYRVK